MPNFTMPESGTVDVDICVIGAGAGGLVSTSGAAQLGLKTVLIEPNDMGGECLNTGCVPSKALLSAAKAAKDAAGNAKLGVSTTGKPVVDFQAVMAHVRSVITAIEPHDSQERFEGLGAVVIRDWAKFTSRNTVQVGARTIRFKKAVIATGSSPFIPPIPGIHDVPFLTNENLWDITALPDHLLIIGGGAIGAEMAQAFARLGSKVTVFEANKLLGRVDRDGAQLLRERMASEGIDLLEDTMVSAVRSSPDGAITLEHAAGNVSGSHLLVAAGRTVKTDHLGLDHARVFTGKRGIDVDDKMRTSNPRIYAVGDCNGQYQLTHAAGQEAGHFIKSALFKLPFGIKRAGMVHVTYTDPEIAQAGMTADEAREKHGGGIRVIESGYDHNDRALAEGVAHGVAKLILSPKGKILGASIAGPHAGELIHIWSLALDQGLKLRQLSSYIAPYPTFSELNKALVGAYFQDAVFSPKTRALVRFLNFFS